MDVDINQNTRTKIQINAWDNPIIKIYLEENCLRVGIVQKNNEQQKKQENRKLIKGQIFGPKQIEINKVLDLWVYEPNLLPNPHQKHIIIIYIYTTNRNSRIKKIKERVVIC